MKPELRIAFLLIFTTPFLFSCNQEIKETFPDGTEISEWFFATSKVDVSELGKMYSIADYGAVADDFTMNTEAIQQLIDKVSSDGGGVIVVPEGIFKSGALFFKSGTHLHVHNSGMLKGSDDISDYPIRESRMEGQNLDYFPALVNASPLM